MQQQYVYLNTTKNLEETERAVKELGMEVIFKSGYAQIDVDDLTNEERNAWIDSLETEVDRVLESVPVLSKTLEDLAQKGKKHANEICSLLKQYRENSSKELLDKIKMLNTIASSELKNAWQFTPTPYQMLQYITYPSFRVTSSVSVSCLIAKKGENVVRYIGILENKDPILTIMGPEASSIKEALQD